MHEENGHPDNVTLQRLLLDHEASLRCFINKRLGNDLRSILSPDDVLQEVWITVFKTISSFRLNGQDSFEIWLKSVATRTAINMAKSARRLKRGGGVRALPGEDDPCSSCLTLFDRVAGKGRSPSREVSSLEAAKAIRNVLVQLPEERRLAVTMRFLEGKSFGEIAKATGKTKLAVRSIIYRSLRQMRARLGSSRRYFSDTPSTSFQKKPDMLQSWQG